MNLTILNGAVTIDTDLITATTSEIQQQLEEYEAGSRRSFDLEIEYPDSFTGSVMEAMAGIPYGETRTYGDLADQLDTAPVAVGQACGNNPVPIVVPCHRVLGHDGGLRGYSAAGGLDLKARLLAHEGAIQQLDDERFG